MWASARPCVGAAWTAGCSRPCATRGGFTIGPDAASERSHEQLRVHDRLHAAIWRRGLTRLEVAERFAALPKRFDPAAALLGYELGLLEGAPPGADVRESLLARWPGWAWWLAAVDAGRGPLARMRARQTMLTATSN